MSVIKSFVGDEEGAALPEYGLLVALVAIVCIGAVALLGGQISAVLGRVTAALTPAAAA